MNNKNLLEYTWWISKINNHQNIIINQEMRGKKKMWLVYCDN